MITGIHWEWGVMLPCMPRLLRFGNTEGTTEGRKPSEADVQKIRIARNRTTELLSYKLSPLAQTSDAQCVASGLGT